VRREPLQKATYLAQEYHVISAPKTTNYNTCIYGMYIASD